jgi:hypothetical protein
MSCEGEVSQEELALLCAVRKARLVCQARLNGNLAAVWNPFVRQIRKSREQGFTVREIVEMTEKFTRKIEEASNQ